VPIVIRRCPQAQDEHGRSRRQYAHTFHLYNSICVADAFDSLPDEHKAAILLHELGHLVAGPRASEAEADSVVEEITGVKIWYVDSPYGDQLQYVDSDIAKKVLNSLFRLSK